LPVMDHLAVIFRFISDLERRQGMAFREVWVTQVMEVLRAWLAGAGKRPAARRAGVDVKTESPRVLWRRPIHGRVGRWEQHGSILKYPDELRDRAIRLVLDVVKDQETSVTAACRKVGGELGIKADTLRGWAKQAQIYRGLRRGTSTADAGAGAGER